VLFDKRKKKTRGEGIIMPTICCQTYGFTYFLGRFLESLASEDKLKD